jgi:hypothetical protein
MHAVPQILKSKRGTLIPKSDKKQVIKDKKEIGS